MILGQRSCSPSLAFDDEAVGLSPRRGSLDYLSIWRCYVVCGGGDGKGALVDASREQLKSVGVSSKGRIVQHG